MKKILKSSEILPGDMATVEVISSGKMFTVTGPVGQEGLRSELHVMGHILWYERVHLVEAWREGPEFDPGTIGQATFANGRCARGAWGVRNGNVNLFFAFTAIDDILMFPRELIVRFVADDADSCDQASEEWQ